MTGPEMKAWREAAGLTLNQAATMLNGDVTQPTLSRWEQSEKPIPQWASDIFLGATKITLSVAELHALLDYARRTNQSFNQVLAEAIRAWLSRQQTTNSPMQGSTSNPTYAPPVRKLDLRHLQRIKRELASVRAITQHQLEDILIHEGLIRGDAIEDPYGYDGGDTELRVSIATREINALLRNGALSNGGTAHD